MVGSAASSQVMARVRTVAVAGLDPAPVDVEVQLSGGLPAFTIVGLPDKAVAESRERVRAALSSLSLALPPKRITVNLAPADLAKEGSHFDLPIALGLLTVMGILPEDALADRLVLGELGLDGSTKPVPGVLAAALIAAEQDLNLVCPLESGAEAAWLSDRIGITAGAHLLHIVRHLRGEERLADVQPAELEEPPALPDLRDVKGQESAKRALEVAAAGGHHVLMTGPPGAGKSMLAARLVGLLPPMPPEQMLEVGLIRSISGRLRQGKLMRHRPMRSPHHAASMAAMVGGGTHARPGEISLAHQGVLFLDELPEFSRQVLEALRQPLESGEVTVARANHHVTYPARVQLIAAMNPCRCGHLDDASLCCNKAPRCALDYQKRISGPMMDRIDIHLDVPAVSLQDMSLPVPSEGSHEAAARVAAVRDVQRIRFEALNRPDIQLNAHAEGELLQGIAELDQAGSELLNRATERLKLSARGYHRILRVARTIADLAGSDMIKKAHLAEAIVLRRRTPRAAS